MDGMSQSKVQSPKSKVGCPSPRLWTLDFGHWTWLSFQCADDRVDVVPNHSLVRPLRRPFLPHRIGKQLAADDDFVTPRGAPLEQRLDVLVRDARFHEHGFDLPLDEEAHQVVDLLDARLAVGADPLDAADFDAIRSSEVLK